MKELYERDYSQWAETLADLLASGNFTQLDIENLVEEVRDLSKRERDRLLSSLRFILHHLLKWDYQSNFALLTNTIRITLVSKPHSIDIWNRARLTALKMSYQAIHLLHFQLS